MIPFAWPERARFGERVPRDKLFALAGGGKAIRDLYAAQVERITWTHKLFPASVNLRAGASVPEIVVLEVVLRADALDDRVLAHIDEAVPRHTLFELRRDGEVALAGAFKRRSDADASHMVIDTHARGAWHPADAPHAPLPTAIDLDGLYAGLLRSLWPHPARANESLRAHAERLSEAASCAKTVERLRGRVRREKRFGRQVELNRELREAERRWGELTAP